MSPLPSPWTALFAVVDAIADGITLAAKTLCPEDHQAAERARAAADAFADTQPPLSDDDLVAVHQFIEERFGGQTSPAADPDAPGGVAGGAVGIIDATAAAGDQSSRAEGTQRADAPGEVSADTPDAAPSPGDLSLSLLDDSEFFSDVADVIDACADRIARDGAELLPQFLQALNASTVEMLGSVAAEARNRAAQFAAAESEPDQEPVREDDLAAHITAIRSSWAVHGVENSLTFSDETARELLSEYRITRKK